MAASAATSTSSLGLCPNYAVVCSFLERYGALLDLPELTFPELERSLQDSASVPKLLVDLHVKLLRKIGKSVSADRWEKYLVKVCQEFNTTWAWELEQKGYKEMQTECKAAILKYLCECQFDENVKFKTAINEEEPDKMRVQPIGRDKDGQMYWFQLDQDDNVRVYVEEQDDLDGSSWKCIVKSRNELAEVVALLKTQIDPELLKKEAEKVAEADEKNQKTEGEVKKSESSSDEDSKDSGRVALSITPTNSQKATWSDGSSSHKNIVEGGAEAEPCPAADVHTCGRSPAVKTEPLDISDGKISNETAAAPIKSENGEEVKTNGEVKTISAEEIQQALKNQQQAKIPLKKRGMKFSEDFEKTSSIIVPKPTLHQGNHKHEQAPEQVERGPSTNDHVNGDDQKPLQIQTDTKPEELETAEQQKAPSGAGQDGPAEKTPPSPPLPKDSKDPCEERQQLRGPSLNTDQSQASETKSTGEEAGGELTEAADPDSVQNTRAVAGKLETEAGCGGAPENLEPSGSADAGEVEAAKKKEPSQPSEGTLDSGIKEESTAHSRGSTSVEEPPGPSERTDALGQPDPQAARTKEEEKEEEEQRTNAKSVTSEHKSDHENAKLPSLDRSAETNQGGENLEKGRSIGAGDHQDDDLHPQQQQQEQDDCGGKSGQTEALNGGEPLLGPQARTKRPAHRRKAEVQTDEWPADTEADASAGRSLRRSPRISKPTAKAVEVQDKSSTEEKQEEDKSLKDKDEEEEVKATQKKPREKKPEQEGQSRSKGRKRRKVRWSNTRTHRKKRSSEDEASEQESSEEEESEEEDDSDEDYQVERSRRRRNRERRSSDSCTSSDDDLPPNDDPCKHCGLPNHPELILLCDSCDSGYHTACLRPPLMIIPDGEWFCPPCQHKQLCDKLQEQLQNLDAALKKKERAERRKERLIYVGISVENIITPSVEEEPKPEVIKEKKKVKKMKSWGRRSTRNKKSISYRFDEFDEAIEEAIEEDVKEAEGGGAGRGKDMSNITGHRGKDMSAILQAEDGEEAPQPPRSSAAQRRKKRRRLNDLDSDSTVDEEESEEEFCLSESSEEEFVASDNESEAETGGESNHSEGSEAQRVTSRIRNPPQRRHSSRKRQRPSWYSDEEEEESGEEEEDEIVTEGSSEFSDGDLDVSRRRSRRSHKAQVNYRETSESEGSQAETNRSKMKPRRQQESSDSEVSFSGDSDEESRGKRRTGSSEDETRERRRRLALKRRRASEEDNSDDSSDDSSEEDRPVRKRVNRIDSDDDDEDTEDTWVKKKVDEDSNPADGKLEAPSSNGLKSPEGPAPPRDLATNTEPPKNATALAANGVSGPDVAGQDDDEDDLLGVTDLVDYVCNNEDL